MMNSSHGTPKLDREEIEQLNQRFSGRPPQEVLTWAVERFGGRIALASSFGVEDVALIDMAVRVNPELRIITLDTWRLPTETYEVIDRIRERYGVGVDIYYPDLPTVDRMVKEAGYNLFFQSVANRKLCCAVRKVEPLERALTGLDGWITGMRRDQGVTRTEIDMIEIDEVHQGMVKLNPLAGWSSEQVWEYVRANAVPYNSLHDKGYPSIGCAPCTRGVADGGDPRSGRWWWEQDDAAKECGIHVGYDENNQPFVVHGATPTSQ